MRHSCVQPVGHAGIYRAGLRSFIGTVCGYRSKRTDWKQGSRWREDNETYWENMISKSEQINSYSVRITINEIFSSDFMHNKPRNECRRLRGHQWGCGTFRCDLNCKRSSASGKNGGSLLQAEVERLGVRYGEGKSVGTDSTRGTSNFQSQDNYLRVFCWIVKS